MSFPNWFWHGLKKYSFLLHKWFFSFLCSMNDEHFSNICGFVSFERKCGLVHYGLQDLNIFLSSLYAVRVFGFWNVFECRITSECKMNETKYQNSSFISEILALVIQVEIQRASKFIISFFPIIVQWIRNSLYKQ